MSSAQTIIAATFPKVNVRLYRDRVAQSVGFSELEMDLLQLESGCAFIEAVLSQVPGVPNAYTEIAKNMMFDHRMEFWSHWHFIFLNKCMRLVHDWQSYTSVMATLADNGREKVIQQFMALSKDDISMGQFDTYLNSMTRNNPAT